MFYDNIHKLFSTERKETICVKSDWLTNTCIVIRKLFDMHLIQNKLGHLVFYRSCTRQGLAVNRVASINSLCVASYKHTQSQTLLSNLLLTQCSICLPLKKHKQKERERERKKSTLFETKMKNSIITSEM